MACLKLLAHEDIKNILETSQCNKRFSVEDISVPFGKGMCSIAKVQ